MADGFQKILNNYSEYAKNWLGDTIIGAIKYVLNGLLHILINSGYWICLFTSLVALLLYIAGIKKAGKYVGISFILFFILESLKVVIG